MRSRSGMKKYSVVSLDGYEASVAYGAIRRLLSHLGKCCQHECLKQRINQVLVVWFYETRLWIL